MPRCIKDDVKLKTTYDNPIQRIEVRNHPTYQSTLFTSYEHGRRLPGGLKATIVDRPVTPPPRYGHKHAMQTTTGMARIDRSFDKGRTIRPAGVFTVDNDGMPVMAAKLSQVADVMKVDRSTPVRDSDTTYNRVHNKTGYPCHQTIQRLRPEVAVKHEALQQRTTAVGKRMPFEVKSRPC